MSAKTRILGLLFLCACGEKTTLQCAEDVLQECDAEGTCTDVQDCAADDMICHDMICYVMIFFWPGRGRTKKMSKNVPLFL